MPGAGADPEDVVLEVLGYALGASGSGGVIDDNFRLKTVEYPEGTAWIKLEERGEKTAGGPAPGKRAGKLLFWRKMSGYHIEWVRIGFGTDSEDDGLSKAKTSNSVPTMTALGGAWTKLHETVPGLVGADLTSVLDANSINGVSTLFSTTAAKFENWHATLGLLISNLDQDAGSFRGSASEAFVQRVRVAMVAVADAKARADSWGVAVASAQLEALNFTNDVKERVFALGTEDGGRLLNPLEYVRYALNHANLSTVFEYTTEDSNTTKDLADTGARWASDGLSTNSVNKTPTIYISFPDLPVIDGLPHGPWDVFRVSSWHEIDAVIRAGWAARVRQVFNESPLSSPANQVPPGGSPSAPGGGDYPKPPTPEPQSDHTTPPMSDTSS